MKGKILITASASDEIQIGITTPVEVREKHNGKAWSVICHSLKSFGYSATSKEDAIKELENTIHCFFKLHLKNNSLDKALSKLGWNKSVINDYNSEVDIPGMLGGISTVESFSKQLRMAA